MVFKFSMNQNVNLSAELQTIVDQVNQAFEAKSAVRDITLSRSRTLIRYCANSIRATHRGDDEEARTLLQTAREAAAGEGRR